MGVHRPQHASTETAEPGRALLARPGPRNGKFQRAEDEVQDDFFEAPQSSDEIQTDS
jgi:hypothetical protein